MRVLCDYSWPGNVRQLRNCMEVLAVTVEGAIGGGYLVGSCFCSLAAVVCVDYLVWGRYPIQLKHVPKVTAEELVSATGNAAGGSDRRMAHDDRASTER